MLFRGDFGAILHIDIPPPLYVTRTEQQKMANTRSVPVTLAQNHALTRSKIAEVLVSTKTLQLSERVNICLSLLCRDL
jgi:hypothetical protein